MNPRRHARGFSLLEVVAAVLLLAITFTALMKVAGSSLNLASHAAERSEAAMRARSLLDSAFVLEPIRTGSSSGRFDRQFRWRLQVTPWRIAGTVPAPMPAAAPTLRLYQLDLEVLWRSGARERRAHFSTLRLAAPEGGAGPTGAP
jgi:general secretion pathway protein I